MSDTTSEQRTREAPLTAGEWMRDLINATTPPGDFRVHEVAGDVWERAVRENADLFWEFLQVNGESIIRDAIRAEQRSRRNIFYGKAGRSDWLDAAEKYQRTGDQSVFGPFEVHYAVDERHTQRRVGDMRGADHLFVATRDQSRSDFSGLKAAFHRRVAEVIGRRTTEEVMSEEDYNKLFNDIVGHEERATPPNL